MECTCVLLLVSSIIRCSRVTDVVIGGAAVHFKLLLYSCGVKCSVRGATRVFIKKGVFLTFF